jgi:hypothetical protein
VAVLTGLGYWYEQTRTGNNPHDVATVYAPANALMPSLQHPSNCALPSDGSLHDMLRAMQCQSSVQGTDANDVPTLPPAAEDAQAVDPEAEKFMADCQTQPWAPVQPTPLFKVPRTAQLEHQLLSGRTTGNPIVSEQNPMGNPLTYDYYTAVNMDKPLASSVPQQEYPRFYNSQTEFPEGLFINPVPDQTGMARPVYFPQSSEVGRSILQNMGTGYVGR